MLKYLLVCCLWQRAALSLLAAKDEQTFPALEDTWGSFHSRVEVSIENKNFTSYVEEYFDLGEDMGRINLLEEGWRFSIFYKNETRQIMEIFEKVCNVNSLKGNEDSDAFFGMKYYGWYDFDGKLIIGPSALLRKGSRLKTDFKDKAVARGIECLKWEANIGDVKIQYFFSEPNWTRPIKGPDNRVPVRISVTGKIKGRADPVDQVFDYVFFDPIVRDSRVFEPPIGVGCKGKEEEMTAPNLPAQFSFVAEISKSYGDDNPKSRVDVFKIWYDSNNKFTRIDSYAGGNSMSRLSDYNTGVMYDVIGNRKCEIKPMRNEAFESYNIASTGMMMDQYEVFGLTGDIYYLSKTYSRGIQCDTWETVKYNITFGNTTYKMVVYTYYFSSDWYEFVADGVKEDRVPLRVVITGYQKDGVETYKQELNLFGFRNSMGTELFSTFPIEACYRVSSQKLYFYMAIPALESAVRSAESQSKVFTEKLKSAIIKTAGISMLRIPFFKVDYEKQGIAAVGVILERPPYIFAFDEGITGMTPTDNTELQKGVFMSEDDCAKICLDSAKGCLSFYYCEAGNGADCLLSYLPPDADAGKKREDFQNCLYFTRNELNSTTLDLPANEAYQKLESAVKAEELKVLWKVPSKDNVVFAVKEIRQIPNPFERDQDELDYTVAKVGYEIRSAETTVEGLKAVSEDECYRQCKREPSFSCASFSFCSDGTRRCLLSSLLATTANISEFKEAPYCKVYVRSYIQFFDEQPGKMPKYEGDKNLTTKSDVLCAKSCREEKELTCRSFSFCKVDGQCQLFKTHVLNINPKDLVDGYASCVFYSAKFIADYRYMGHVIAKGEELMQSQKVSLEECARTCSEDSNAQCKSFNYCPGTVAEDGTCTMFSFYLEGEGTDSEISDTCYHYDRRDGMDDWNVIKEPTPKTLVEEEAAGGYSPGQLAGLLIGMIVFGAVLGAGGFMLYSCYRSKKIKDDGMRVGFTK